MKGNLSEFLKFKFMKFTLKNLNVWESLFEHLQLILERNHFLCFAWGAHTML